jgi:hypothetical protein
LVQRPHNRPEKLSRQRPAETNWFPPEAPRPACVAARQPATAEPSSEQPRERPQSE